MSMASRRESARLYLVTPPVLDPGAIADDLAAALNAADIAAVLLRLADGSERDLVARIAALRILIQSNGAALLLDGYPQLVAQAEADGAHLAGADALKAAGPALKPNYIAGCGALSSRHDAMLAGETGADYVMFGEPDVEGHRPRLEAILERVGWWADVMTIPCVGYAARLDEIVPLAQAGAEFVALSEEIWRSDMRAAVDALAPVPEPVR
ncbi:MAG: thiamine phosphate synthase [Alphaproteobacteria bacterium]